MTNDAEAVVKAVARQFPFHRIVYRDSMGTWDELEVKDGVFAGFRAFHGFVPNITG